MDMTPLKTKQPDTMILGSFQAQKSRLKLQAPGSRKLMVDYQLYQLW
jgi:hypothetical protein